MMEKQDLYAEAYRRGILPPRKKEAYEEAVKRGLFKKPTPSVVKSQPPVGDAFSTALHAVFPTDELAGFARGAADTATLGFSDTIEGGINKAGNALANAAEKKFYGDKAVGVDLPYSHYKKEASEANKQAENDNPTAYLAGEAAGIVGSGVGAGLTKAGAAIGRFARGTEVAADASRLQKAANAVSNTARRAVATAPVGGVYSANKAEDGKVLESAAEGALAAGATAGVVPYAVALASKPIATGIKALTDKLAKRDAIKAGEMAAEIEKLPKPAQKILNRLRDDFQGDDTEVVKRLNSYFSTKDKTLLETGGRKTTNLAEGSALFPSGDQKASEFFTDRIEEAPSKLKTTIGKTVSPESNYYDDLDKIVKEGREKAAPLYSAFYKGNAYIQSPVIDRILTTPEGKRALNEAVKDVRNEMSLVARPDPELTSMMREMVDLGKMKYSEGGVARGLKPKTLDYIKRAMDGTINRAYKQGDDAGARRIIQLKNGLKNEIITGDKTGAYQKALSESGDYLSNRDAMEAGKKFFEGDDELLARSYSALGSSEKKSFRAGVQKALRDKIFSTRDGANVANFINTKINRNKLATILSPKEYSSLMNDATNISNIYKLRNQILGNSRTKARDIAAQEFDNAGLDIATDIAQRGVVRTGVKRLFSLVAQRASGLSDKTAGEVAEMLYETDPKKKYQIVKSLTNEINRSGDSLQKTEAAKKLQAFYEISDFIGEAGKKLKNAPISTGRMGVALDDTGENNT